MSAAVAAPVATATAGGSPVVARPAPIGSSARNALAANMLTGTMIASAINARHNRKEVTAVVHSTF
jgi:hypothetical protein